LSEMMTAVCMGVAVESVAGFVAPGFEIVREAFIANFEAGLEVGAGFAVCRHGELLVDLWGGHADRARSALVQQNSLFNLWSTTKGLAAACIALLVDRGKLNYEIPVTRYWPEFAANGKDAVTIGELMSHQAGICGPREPVTIEDYYRHDRVASLLAVQAPFFKPGSSWGYHALAIGTLADELVRRVEGRPIGEFFATEIAAPLALDAFLGLPEAEDHRRVEIIPPSNGQVRTFDIPNPQAYRATMENPAIDPNWPNCRSWRSTGLAAAGGSANARSLARLYGTLASGGEFAGTQLVSLETILEATRQRVAGVDQVAGEYNRYAAGFELNMNGNMGAHQHAFGHSGWGGSAAFGDPQRGLGVAYVMNRMLTSDWQSVDLRLSRLLRATYAALNVQN
jgi:CubicO group peptidase (beta-lactamase class C family)